MSWIFLAIAIGFNCVANVLIKMTTGGGQATLLQQFLSPLFIAAGALYVLNLAFYALAIRSLPMAVAYPVLVGMTAVSLAVITTTLLGETLNAWNYAGIALAVVAVGLMTVER